MARLQKDSVSKRKKEIKRKDGRGWGCNSVRLQVPSMSKALVWIPSTGLAWEVANGPLLVLFSLLINEFQF